MNLRNILLVSIVLLSGCVITPNNGGGMVVAPVGPGYSTTVMFPPVTRTIMYVPNEARDYLGQDYYYYGPTVVALMPSMIYGNGWKGRGYYHVRPNQRYNWYWQEERWYYNGHK